MIDDSMLLWAASGAVDFETFWAAAYFPPQELKTQGLFSEIVPVP